MEVSIRFTFECPGIFLTFYNNNNNVCSISLIAETENFGETCYIDKSELNLLVLFHNFIYLTSKARASPNAFLVCLMLLIKWSF